MPSAAWLHRRTQQQPHRQMGTRTGMPCLRRGLQHSRQQRQYLCQHCLLPLQQRWR